MIARGDRPGQRRLRQTPPCRRDDVAEQRAGHHPPDRRQRQQREHRHRKDAGSRGDSERRRIERQPQRHRQHGFEERRRHRRGQRADDKTGGDAGSGQDADQRRVDDEHQPARRAQGFERRDGRGLARDEIGHGAADADPADEQCGNPDQAEEQRDPVDKALQHRARLAGGAHLPAGIGEFVAGLAHPGGRVAAGRELQPVVIGHQRTGLEQPGPGKRGGRDDDARPEGKPAQRRIGRALDRGAQLDSRGADLEAVADRETEPLGDRGLGDRAVDPVARGERRRQVLRWVEGDVAVERIGGVDRLQLDQRVPGPVGRRRHRPQQRDLGNRAALVEELPLGRVRLAVDQPSRDIAAEQGASVLVDRAADRSAERADRGDRPDPEHQAGEENAKPAHPAAQFTASQAESVDHGPSPPLGGRGRGPARSAGRVRRACLNAEIPTPPRPSSPPRAKCESGGGAARGAIRRFSQFHSFCDFGHSFTARGAAARCGDPRRCGRRSCAAGARSARRGADRG